MGVERRRNRAEAAERRRTWWAAVAAASAAAAVGSGVAWAAPLRNASTLVKERCYSCDWRSRTGGPSGRPDQLRPRVGFRSRFRKFGRNLLLRLAEDEAAPISPRTYSQQRGELIKVSDQSIMTTAGLLGGLAGLAIGSLWFSAAMFAVFSFITREKQDNVAVSTLRGVARGAIEVLNMSAYLEEKYEVTAQVSGSLSAAAEKAKKENQQNKGVTEAVSFTEKIGSAVQDFNKDVGILETAGSLAASGSDLAATFVGRAVDVVTSSEAKEKFEAELRKATGQKSTNTGEKVDKVLDLSSN